MKKAILLAALFVFAWSLEAGHARAQLTQDQMADMLLTGARKAYNEKQLAFAAGKFREFLSKYSQHKEAPAARYGLALSLLETPGANLQESRDLLQALAANKSVPD